MEGKWRNYERRRDGRREVRFENEINKAIEIGAAWQRGDATGEEATDKLNDLFLDVFSEGYRLGEMK
jgi:hypothetical protein